MLSTIDEALEASPIFETCGDVCLVEGHVMLVDEVFDDGRVLLELDEEADA